MTDRMRTAEDGSKPSTEDDGRTLAAVGRWVIATAPTLGADLEP